MDSKSGSRLYVVKVQMEQTSCILMGLVLSVNVCGCQPRSQGLSSYRPLGRARREAWNEVVWVQEEKLS